MSITGKQNNLGGHNWILLFGGFRQPPAKTTGMRRLYQALLEVQTPTTTVRLLPWTTNTRQLADEIYVTRPRAVVCAAYSYGAGNAFRKLAWRLADRGVYVSFAVLADPVYRSFFPLLAWRAYLPTDSILKPCIKLPPTVLETVVFAQQVAPPFPSPVKAKRVTWKLVSGLPHVAMDDAEVFHETTINAVNLLIRKEK